MGKNVIRVQSRTDRKTVSEPVCCVADVDSCAGVAAQRSFLLWLCAALQFVLRDLQPPHQPSGGGNTPDVPAALLLRMRYHYCDGSVTQVHTHPHTSNTLKGKFTTQLINNHKHANKHTTWVPFSGTPNNLYSGQMGVSHMKTKSPNWISLILLHCCSIN